MKSIVVVGASLAGLRTVETLREEGFSGRLSLVGAEPHLPYDRPPLSKQVLTGAQTPAAIRLREDDLGALELDLHLGHRATSLNLRERTVEIDRVGSLGFDALVIATGAQPRTLPIADALPGVYVLRTLDDSLKIRDEFEAGPKVVILGAGFIGLEVAAAARSRDLDVTVVEAAAAPLSHIVGPELGETCVSLHKDHGTKFRLGTKVVAFEGRGRVERVRLDDGSAVDADIVVVGIGAAPATTWLEGSGLTLGDGVICDATCATSAPGVFAAGDVARWHNPLFGKLMRVEHWTNATEQGTAVARAVLARPGNAQPVATVPYFWSDQFSTKIQFVGIAGNSSEVRVVAGAVEDRRFAAIYRQGDRLGAALAFDSPRLLMRFRALIARRASWDEALAFAETAR